MESAMINAMCRCCASEGAFKDVKSRYLWMGEEEIYSDMLKECFDINLFTSEDGDDGGICEVCITQLRNAVNFKKQVLHTEDQFKKHLQNKLFKPSIVKVEIAADDDNDSDDNVSAEEGYSGTEYEIPIKTEIPEEPKPKKRAAAAKATSSRAKKAKSEDGETSTKRARQKHTLKKETDGTGILDNAPEVKTNKQKRIVKKESNVASAYNDEEVNTKRQKRILQKESEEASASSSSDNDTEFKTEKLKIAPRTELIKHLSNIKEVIVCSNATPIRRYVGIGYTCCYCDEQYTEPKQLKDHTIQNHEDVNEANFMKDMNMSTYVVKLDITELSCKLCKEQITSLENLLSHLKNVHNRKIYTEIKNHIFPFKFDDDILKCVICSNSFNKFRMLVKHMHIHYRNFICTICDAGFVNRNVLAQHAENHRTGAFTCDFCPKVYSTQTKKKLHERTVHTHSDLMNKCGYCTETFKDYRRKEAHLVEVHGVKSLTPKCQACDKVFSSRKLLSIHVKRDHLMERPHKCTECEMSFFSTTGLKNHMVKHTGSRAFQCTVCLKAFGRKKTLNSHKRIHDEERRYKCEHCGQAFVQKCSWRGHMRSKHGEIV